MEMKLKPKWTLIPVSLPNLRTTFDYKYYIIVFRTASPWTWDILTITVSVPPPLQKIHCLYLASGSVQFLMSYNCYCVTGPDLGYCIHPQSMINESQLCYYLMGQQCHYRHYKSSQYSWHGVIMIHFYQFSVACDCSLWACQRYNNYGNLIHCWCYSHSFH